MKILLSGASGFLGSALRVRFAQHGHEVVRLVRRAPASASEFSWDPAHRQLDPAAFDGVDAVISLSGAGIADRPWTAKRRQVLLSSRIDTTATLSEALAADGRTPVLLQASGIAWYGLTSGPEPYREGDPVGPDWLAQVTKQWEAAATPAVDAGVRVALLRTTPVLDRSGGTLKILKLPFLLGLGAQLGDGAQHMAMISLRDWLRAVDFLLAEKVSGPVNLTIPEPTTNAVFTRELAAAVGRPAFLRAPGAVLTTALGELARTLLADQYVVPTTLTEAGFAFDAPDVASTLAVALGQD